MEWLIANWMYVMVIFYIAEKVVKLTPVKWDDIIVDGIKSVLDKLKPIK